MTDLSIWDGPDNRPSGHGQAMADPTPPWDELANSSSGHGQTMADPMRLTCPRAGNYYVDWAGVCKHFGWNPKELCGPVAMSFNASAAETHCPGGHTAGCKAHQPPKVKGKPFKLAEHKDELQKLGLSVFQQQLKDEREAGKPPPGKPTKVKGQDVYPARLFLKKTILWLRNTLAGLLLP